MKHGVPGRPHQALVHLERREHLAALLRLGLLAHRRPRIGVDRRDAVDRGPRVVQHLERRAVARQVTQLVLDLRHELVAGRRRQSHVHAQHQRPLGERCGDVVAIPDEGHGVALQVAELFVQRQQVGQRLAGVLLVGERVDHVQPRRGRRELHQPILRKRPDHHARHPAFEVAGDVGNRLAFAHRDVLRWRDHVAAEFADGNLEGAARSQ